MSLHQADQWWHALPVVTVESVTDICGLCGLSRDRHGQDWFCAGSDWRIAGFVGTYDRIPDGQWSTHDHRDSHDGGPFSFPAGYLS